ncbi:MAG: branched-chain amino acid ABC transporter permease [Azospirillaceae bacterium]
MTGHGVEARIGAVLAVAAIGLPFILDDGATANLSVWFAFALFAASLAFAWGHCGLLSLGHAVFFGAGAYAMSLTTLGLLPGLPGVASTWLGLALACLVPALIGLAIGAFLFSSDHLQGPFFGIATLAIGVVAARLCESWDYLGGANGLMGVPPIMLGPNGGGPMVFDTLPVYYVMLAMLAAGLVALARVMASPFGRALSAVRQNELRARGLGYDPAWLKTRAYATSAAVAGVAGAMFVVQFGFASPSLVGFALSAEVLIWVAVGGRDSPLAAALAAIAVRLAEDWLSRALGDVWPLVLGLIFIACVMALPRGLFGEAFARLERRHDRTLAPGRDDHRHPGR